MMITLTVMWTAAACEDLQASGVHIVVAAYHGGVCGHVAEFGWQVAPRTSCTSTYVTRAYEQGLSQQETAHHWTWDPFAQLDSHS
jgi:hypothetical protein